MHEEVPEVSPEQVARRLSAGDGAVYLDVRTVEEFVQGHAPEALNVPLYIRCERTGAVVENAEFLHVVRAVVPESSAVLVGCAHGIRSLHAAWMLRRAGYAQVANIGPGWDGRRDFLGRVLVPGWRDAGLPVATGEGDERSYEVLRQRAGARSDV